MPLAEKEHLQPLFLNLKRGKDRRVFAELIRKKRVHRMMDDYKEQLFELYQINNPSRIYSPDFKNEFENHVAKLTEKSPLEREGNWVYYPWLSTVVHILSEKDFWRVRTARNRNLINENEQKKFYDTVVGIGGLSVGNSVALAIVLQGGARHIKLADHDRLALSNTNRVRTGVQNLGLMKIEVAAREIYEINPYAKIDLFPEGITPRNIKRFFDGLDVMVDELDNLAAKYLIREEARRRKIAVVMAADNGDNGVVDIERYDLAPQTPFFHGRMGKVSYDELLNLDKFGIGRMITKHIGPENVTEKMQKSLLEMGKTIVSWPQLGGAALLNGSAAAYCVRKIAAGERLESNRSIVSLDEKFIPGYYSAGERAKRNKAARKFKKILKL